MAALVPVVAPEGVSVVPSEGAVLMPSVVVAVVVAVVAKMGAIWSDEPAS